MRRVVVTGLGAVTPLGVGEHSKFSPFPPLFHSSKTPIPGIRRTWTRLVDGTCGIEKITSFGERFAALSSQVAGLVPVNEKTEGAWKATQWVKQSVWIHHDWNLEDI